MLLDIKEFVKMEKNFFMNIVLIVWWLLFNGWINYLEFKFMNIHSYNYKRKFLFFWIFINQILIIININFNFFGVFVFHVLLLFAFAILSLNVKCSDTIAPLIVILTLYTFIEGYSAIFMYWASISITSAFQGRIIQFFISILLDLLFWVILKFIYKKYYFAMCQTISSYLYILLLPCSFIVLAIRVGLRLDNHYLEKYFSSMGINMIFIILLIMIVTTIFFLMMIKIFSKIISLSQHERNVEILKSQINGQKIYIEESQERNKEFSSFQHDIDNHLLVLSGLLHDGKYTCAKQYIDKLYIRSTLISFPVSTGIISIDALLKEKLNYAKSNGIDIDYDISIPSNINLEDLDLCIIISNILDNAINACILNKGKISISAKVQSNFIIIKEVNDTNKCDPIVEGTGIRNIKTIANKYNGAVKILNDNMKFKVSVLLCLPN